MTRDTLLRRRTTDKGARVIVRFTAQVMNEVRLEWGALAAAMIGEGLSGLPQGWVPPAIGTPCYAWVEYCLEATGGLTRGLRVLAGTPEVRAREQAAADAGAFAGSLGGL